MLTYAIKNKKTLEIFSEKPLLHDLYRYETVTFQNDDRLRASPLAEALVIQPFFSMCIEQHGKGHKIILQSTTDLSDELVKKVGILPTITNLVRSKALLIDETYEKARLPKTTFAAEQYGIYGQAVKSALDLILPSIQAHGGTIEVKGVTENSNDARFVSLHVETHGSCVSCASAGIATMRLLSEYLQRTFASTDKIFAHLYIYENGSKTPSYVINKNGLYDSDMQLKERFAPGSAPQPKF